jgi:hypothetical protein
MATDTGNRSAPRASIGSNAGGHHRSGDPRPRCRRFAESGCQHKSSLGAFQTASRDFRALVESQPNRTEPENRGNVPIGGNPLGTTEEDQAWGGNAFRPVIAS